MADGTLIKAALSTALTGRPIAKAIALEITDAIVRASNRPENPITPAQVPAMVEVLIETMTKSPTVVNATNSEPWWQSRVLVGSTTVSFATVVMAVDVLAEKFGFTEVAKFIDDKLISSIGVIAAALGIGFVFIGRLKSGLKPLSLNPLQWIGLKK